MATQTTDTRRESETHDVGVDLAQPHIISEEGSEKDIGRGHANYHGIDTQNVIPGADEIYEAKIGIMNEALIDLGMGSYQWKVFFTTGLGWFVDNVRSPSYLSDHKGM